VSNAQQLAAALQTAQAGEVIKLAAGSYGDVQLSGLHFSGAGVTITSADPTHEAVVNSVWASQSSGLTVDHLNVQLPASEQYGVYIGDASNVSVSNLTIQGTGAPGAYNGVGVMVRSSTGVSLTHSDMGQLDTGMVVGDSSTVTVSNNTVHDVSGDGMDTVGTTNELISSNTFTNFSPGDGVHPDAIQFFADGSGVGDNNILVEDNVITRGTGTVMQGVFVEHTSNIEITGNAMAGTMYNGISLSTTDHALVTNNYIQGFTDMNSGIMTRGQSADVSVTNNISSAIASVQDGGLPNPNYVESGNTIIADANVGDYTAVNAWLAQHLPSTASLSDAFFLQ
jgi:parallel beta-helix repeat protein